VALGACERGVGAQHRLPHSRTWRGTVYRVRAPSLATQDTSAGLAMGMAEGEKFKVSHPQLSSPALAKRAALLLKRDCTAPSGEARAAVGGRCDVGGGAGLPFRSVLWTGRGSDDITSMRRAYASRPDFAAVFSARVPPHFGTAAPRSITQPLASLLAPGPTRLIG
jgi:hypothetical protein